MITPRRPLQPDSRAMAYLSFLAYQKVEDRASVLDQLIQSKILPSHIGLWQNSSPEFVIVKSDERRIIIVAFRGTAAARDLVSDAGIFLGLQMFMSRFRESLKMMQGLKRRFPDWQIALTGHSLGGSIALYVGYKLNFAAEAFNPGTSPWLLAQMAFALFRRLKPHHVNHIIGDPISAMSITKNRTNFKPYPSMDPHTIRQFL